MRRRIPAPMRVVPPYLIAALAIFLCGHPVDAQVAPAEHVEFFEKNVRPILVTHCQGCHNANVLSAGLDLSSAAGLRKGADTGPVVVPGKIETSRLLNVVGYLERIKMP